MGYTVHITGQAERDLDNAAGYLRSALLNPSAAYGLLLAARDGFSSLSEFPARNRLVDDPVLSSWGIRFLTVKNYLAFYIVSEEDKTVHVVRFLYNKRSWHELLKQGVTLE